MPASSADATPGSDSDGVPMVQSSVAEYTRNDTAATATMPAASPSRPSMKLIALMVITTIRMVSVTLRSGSSGNSPPLGVGSQGSAWPLQTRMPAAATWAASLLTAPRPPRAAPPGAAARRARGAQLAARAEPPPVVDEPDHDHEPAGQQQPGRGPRPGRLERVLQEGQPARDQQPGDQAAVHGQAAKQRCRCGVGIPGSGLMYRASTNRDPSDQRDQQVCHRSGDQQDQGVLGGLDLIGCHQRHFMALARRRRAAHRQQAPRNLRTLAWDAAPRA